MCKEEFYMMKRNKRVFVLSLAVFIFLIGIWGTGVAAKETEKTNDGRILFISSYSYGWDTVQSQIEGIKDGIDDNTPASHWILLPRALHPPFSPHSLAKAFPRSLLYCSSSSWC